MGLISGSGALGTTGAGTLVLGSANTYSGGTTLAGSGLVAINVDSVGSAGSPTSGAFGTGTVNLAGAQLRAATGSNRTVANAVTISADTTFATTTTEKSLTFTGPVTLSGATRTLDVRIGATVASSNLTFSGAIGDGGNGYGITKTGTGMLTLSGNNTYSGVTTISAGNLTISHANALGATGAGSGTTIASGAALQLSNNLTIGEAISLNSTGISNGGGIRNTGGDNTISGAITSGASSRITSYGGNLTLTGGYTSSGLALSLGAAAANTSITVRDNAINLGAGGFTAYGTSSGSNIIVLGVAGNTFGSVNINYAGTLRTDVANAWNPSATLVMGSTSGESVGAANLLNLNGNSQAFASLTSYTINSTSTITSASAATLTVNGTTTRSTYNGTISGAISLVKEGSSTQTLAGNNTYTGATTINGGTLHATNLQSSSGVTVNSGGSIGAGNAAGAVGTLTVGNITLNGGGGYTWDLGNVTGTAGTNWDLITATSTTIGADANNKFTIYLSGNPTGWSPSTNYASGWNILQWGNLNSTFDANAFIVNSDNFTGAAPTGSWTINSTGGFLNLSYTAPAAMGIWTGGNGSNWTTAANWQGGTLPSNTSPLEFRGSGGVSTNNNLLNTVAGITFTSNATGSYTLDGTALTIRAGGITNNSTSAQTVSMDITMADSQTFNAGAANLTVSGAIANAGFNLEASGNNTVSISGNISGSGGVQKTGNGTLALSGSNSYTGATTVSAGTLSISATSALAGTSGITLANATTLVRTGSSATVVSAPLTLGDATAGSYTVNNDATAGNLTFTGAIAGGTGGTAGSKTLNIRGNGTTNITGNISTGGGNALTLNIGGYSNSTISGRITGAVAVTQSYIAGGAGSVTLNNDANDFTGAVRVEGAGSTKFYFTSIADFGTASSLGRGTAGTAITLSNGYLVYTGTASSSSNRTWSGANSGGIENNSATGVLTLSGNYAHGSANGTFNLTGSNTGNNTFGGRISAAASGAGSLLNLTKAGTGTWILTGSNTFTGAIAANSGRLLLDYSNNDVLSTANALTLGGGTLEFKGAASGTTAETLGAVTVTGTTGMSSIVLNKNGGSGVNLTLGAVTGNTFSSLFIDLGGDASNSVKIGTAINPTASGGSAIMQSYIIKDATGRIDFAQNGNSTSNNLTALNATTALPTGPAASQNYALLSNTTVTNSNQSNLPNTLRIDPNADGQSLTLNQGTASNNTLMRAILMERWQLARALHPVLQSTTTELVG